MLTTRTQFVVALTPELADKCNSLDELVRFWFGDLKIPSNGISVLCDDFGQMAIDKQQKWLSQLDKATGWVLTSENENIYSKYKILRICNIEPELLYPYAEQQMSYRKAKRVLSIIKISHIVSVSYKSGIGSKFH